MTTSFAADRQYDDNWPTCVYAYAWFRVMSEHLNPDSVTTLLELEPTSTQKKGDLPDPDSRFPKKFSGWFLETESFIQSRDARRHIDWLTERLAGRSEALATLRSEGHTVDLCVCFGSIGQGGPLIGPRQLRALADLGLDFWLDLGFPQTADRMG